ncbi:hypothetical protein [Algoriphagus vanfongensis]|uniref:glycosyl-4,4'-diaponeurosporenoate acyltransferase CrtO family protein n=1 Tax=Algoriphagus vanfongensis TaxID=426371 RepID=UPI000424989C|nr:hypothetical protein [Algoriphagus vanfongensis]
MLKHYITFGISISFISWLIGMVFNQLLLKTSYYKELTNLNFIESKAINKWIGLREFQWIVKNTFFKFFNQKIKIDSRKADLTEIRMEMSIAEISHLIAFIFVMIVAVIQWLAVGFLFAVVIMIFNVLLNLYPSLLQQENKRRIDQLIRRQRENW